MKTNRLLIINAFLLLLSVSMLSAAVMVAPVPWAPSSGDGKTDNPSGIQFAGVQPGAEIDIYTISGNFIWRQVNNTGAASTTTRPILWNGKNSSGSDVASGVYLWVVKNPVMTEKGKLIVIR